MDLLTPFSPGQAAPKAGSYWVRHLVHRPPYLAVVRASERLPHCSLCNVIFEYASDVTYGGVSIQNDADLFPAKKTWPL